MHAGCGPVDRRKSGAKTMRLSLALAVAAACGMAHGAWAFEGGQAALTPERIFASPDLSGPVARGVQLAPNGSAVTYLKTKATDVRITDLWIADVKGGAPHLLIDGGQLLPQGRTLSEAEKSRRERMGVQTRGVVDYSWDEEGRYILAPVEGDLWLYQMADGKLRQLTNTPADEIDAKISPHGTFVSYVRENNLYIMPTNGGAETEITQGGSDDQSWASAEFIAAEELERYTGSWWSPDERRIAFTRVDQTGVDIVDRPEINATSVSIVHERYPAAGHANATVELYVEDLADKHRVKVDLGANADIYLARVDWAKDGKTLYVQRLSRDQRRLDLIAVDPATGSGKVILSETSPHWVELSNDFHPLKDGSFLWSSERSGERHLYLYGHDGALIRQVTRGDWPVRALDGVDEAKGVALFIASLDSPVAQRLYAVSYKAPGEPKPLTAADGWSSVSVAKSGDAFVDTYSDPMTPPQTGLYLADGSRVRWIEENRLAEGHPFWPYAGRLTKPKFGSIKASDGETLWWSMRTPPGFDPSKTYPVIVQVYGGPSVQEVREAWNAPESQIYLDAGFILFSLDNRGSSDRSVAFKTAIDRQLGKVEVEDQLAGAAFLKTLPYVDAARIGVTGWSFGGYMTLQLLTVPDSPFAAGVSGAPVTTWTLYDTAYTERYMGTPQSNPAGYANSDILPRLTNLRPNALLLEHGMADDNVVFAHSTRVLYELQNEGKPFEAMPYPGLRHRAGWSPADKLQRLLISLDFFERKLKP